MLLVILYVWIRTFTVTLCSYFDNPPNYLLLAIWLFKKCLKLDFQPVHIESVDDARDDRNRRRASLVQFVDRGGGPAPKEPSVRFGA